MDGDHYTRCPVLRILRERTVSSIVDGRSTAEIVVTTILKAPDARHISSDPNRPMTHDTLRDEAVVRPLKPARRTTELREVFYAGRRAPVADEMESCRKCA